MTPSGDALLGASSRPAAGDQDGPAHYSPAAGLDWQAVPEAMRMFFTQPVRPRDALVPGWPAPETSAALLRAALGLAVDFGTWRALTRDQGLDEEQAVELMVALVIRVAPKAEGFASG